MKPKSLEFVDVVERLQKDKNKISEEKPGYCIDPRTGNELKFVTVSKKYKIPEKTLRTRWGRGDRGERFIRRPKTTKYTKDLGPRISISDIKGLSEYELNHL